MNTFWLHKDPSIAAEWNSDQHVVATIREGCIILQTALAIHGKGNDELPYNVNNKNSMGLSLAKWAAESWENWERQYQMVEALNYEFVIRKRKKVPDSETHDSWRKTAPLYKMTKEIIPEGELTPFPQTHIPPQYRVEDEWEFDEAYRQYYRNEKAEFKTGVAWWSEPRTIPDFMKDVIMDAI